MWQTINTAQTSNWNTINSSSNSPWQQINDAQNSSWQVINAADFIFNATNDGGYSFGSISSGPFSGIGGEVVIQILSGSWQNTNNSQPNPNWSVIQT